ncbi:ERF family protein [Streptomyces sp. NPDC054796]
MNALVESTYEPAPVNTPKDAPRVFAVIAAVMKDAMPVGKNQRNEQQNYQFRGIDDVMSAMAGPMRTHGLFILPSIAEHSQQRDGKMTRTLITMRYRVYGPAGDCLVADVPGEAFDYADKSTNKAQSAALKYLLFSLFMLPVDGRSIDDGDRETPAPPPEHRAEQAQRQQQRRGGQQQARRSKRAEPGPWEQPAPQQPQPDGPPRDFIAEAAKASGPQEFAKVRKAAVAAGAPADYLARLDAIAAQKRAAAQSPGPIADAPGRAMQWTKGQQRDEVDDGADAAGEPAKQEHAAALDEMYDAARDAGIADQAEAAEAFAARFQCQPAAATVAQLREMRDDLLDAVAKGDAA